MKQNKLEKCQLHKKDIICLINEPTRNSVLKCSECCRSQNLPGKQLFQLNDLKDFDQPIPWPSFEFYQCQNMLQVLTKQVTQKTQLLKQFLETNGRKTKEIAEDATTYYLTLKRTKEELQKQKEWFVGLRIRTHLQRILDSDASNSQKELQLQKKLSDDKTKCSSETKKFKTRNMYLYGLLKTDFLGNIKERQKRNQDSSEMHNLLRLSEFDSLINSTSLIRNQVNTDENQSKPKIKLNPHLQRRYILSKPKKRIQKMKRTQKPRVSNKQQQSKEKVKRPLQFQQILPQTRLVHLPIFIE